MIGDELMSNGVRAVILVLAAAVILVCVYSCNGARHRNDMYVTGEVTDVTSSSTAKVQPSASETAAVSASQPGATQGSINVTLPPADADVTSQTTKAPSEESTRTQYTYDENVFLSSVSGDFRYSVSGMEVTIVSYLGKGGEVTVPEKINGRTVTAIGQSAFSGSGGGGGDKITTLTIPSTVTKIGAKAFSSCTALTLITVPASVTEIGSFAFENCPSLTINCEANSAVSVYAQANAIPAKYF